jgi:mono/diheme cytochrome c family protein
MGLHGDSYHADNSSVAEMVLKALKIVAAVVAVLVALAAGAGALAAWMGERKMQRVVDVRVVPVPFAREPAALALGKYLFETRGCGECHGADGGGRVMIDDPNGLYVKTPDITAGAGGVVAGYTEADWVRAIRHGVSPRGRALLVMPGEDYNRLNDGDFAAIVAYTRSLAPAAGSAALIRIPLLVKALYGAGAIQDAAEKIDHRRPPSASVAVAASVEHGGYVANMCIGCHGSALAGGRIPGSPPDWPPAANLTPGEGGVMPRYDTAEKFIAMMRSGKRPDGAEISKVMPFPSLKHLNDVDLNAMYAYLATVPARKAGER